MILVIDNYDSFVFNLARYLVELGPEVTVLRNDAVDFDGIAVLEPQAVVLSPGPGRPVSAGVCLDFLSKAPESLPILGVCLGHQAIAEAFGGGLVPALKPTHGKASMISHDGSGLFQGLPDRFNVGRYHSLATRIDKGSPLTVTARTDDGEVMAFQHHSRPVYGVQFHPESILTEHGYDILRAFLKASGWSL